MDTNIDTEPIDVAFDAPPSQLLDRICFHCKGCGGVDFMESTSYAAADFGLDCSDCGTHNPYPAWYCAIVELDLDS